MINLKSSVMLLLLSGSIAVSGVAGAVPASQPEEGYSLTGLNNAGVQLNRMQDYLERQKVARQISEARKSQKAEVETNNKQETAQGQQVSFVLKQIKMAESAVLTKAEVDGSINEYLDKEVSIEDLYTIVDKINQLYSDKGYFTCKAILNSQTIKEGVVELTLIEGRTGNITVEGNRSTAADYVQERVSLTEGEVDNINELNKDLLLFNATNNAQLRVSMQAGQEPGTTDYVITTYEPQQHVWSLYEDNAGSKNTGEWRTGIFYNNRSLSGRRDNLALTTMFSCGTEMFSANYSNHLNASGTMLNIGYSTNTVEIKKGEMKDLDVDGHAYSASVGLVQPLKVTEELRTELGLSYNQQNSKTDFSGMDWVDDTIKDGNLYYSVTNYGDTSVFYRRHGITAGRSENILNKTRDYTLYQGNLLYQKAYKNRSVLNIRLDGQIAGNHYMPSSRQFYIGGAYSVRGYEESFLGGDHGYAASIEYSFPATAWDDKSDMFLFYDYGAVYGDSAFDDHILSSVGLGLKTNITDKIYASVTVGFPLERHINGTKVSKTRTHFMLNGQF